MRKWVFYFYVLSIGSLTVFLSVSKVYDGAVRDIRGLKETGGLTSFVTSYDPSYHNPAGDLNTIIIGINQPTRIRQVTVMPGDVVLGENDGRK